MRDAQRSARDVETFAIIGAAMEVHRVLGHGFLEAVYQAALADELGQRMIAFDEQVEFHISYKGRLLRTTYRADFVAHANIIIELKALDALTNRERAQLINYLRASSISRGLLINFGAPNLEYERLVWRHNDQAAGGPSL